MTKLCIHCEKKHATVMHACTPEVVVATGSGEDRFQGNNTQSNSGQSNADLFCGLNTMEGSMTALPIVAVKI